MHLLVLTDRPGGGASLLPSLEYLDHTTTQASLKAPWTRYEAALPRTCQNPVT